MTMHAQQQDAADVGGLGCHMMPAQVIVRLLLSGGVRGVVARTIKLHKRHDSVVFTETDQQHIFASS